MSSRREQILAHIASTLAGTVQVGSRIYRSRSEAFARDEAPAIVLALLDARVTTLITALGAAIP